MAPNRSQFDASEDDGHWSIVAEFIDRRDRGEVLDPVEFAGDDPVLAQRLQDCLAGFGWLRHALSGSDEDAQSAGETPMPSSIGEYNIIRELGRGGMGVVYEAVHQNLGRRVALKVLFESALRGRAARERFLREARTAASLHHTNIVPVFDVGTADGHLYFAMQLIEGQSLESLADATNAATRTTDSVTTAPGSTSSDPRLSSARTIAHLGLQAAEALAFAHARGIVHRDIKPSNLLLDQNGTLWVADFGLARRPQDPSVTASGAMVGTPRYMSPEQATAQWKALDGRTDVYSLGVTLYELLTGQPIFSYNTPQQLMVQIIRSDPTGPRRINPRIPRDLETIVLKAMAKRVADRYRSAQELAEDLRRFLAHEPIRARRIGPVGRMVRWCRREPVLASISIVALFAVSAIVATYQVSLIAQRDGAIEARLQAQQQWGDALFYRARAERSTGLAGRRWLSLELLQQSAQIRTRPELTAEVIRSLEIFDVRPVRVLREFGEPATAVCFDPASDRVAVATAAVEGNFVTVWDRKDDSVLLRMAAPDSILSIAFSSDGHWLAGATERHVCLWAVASGHLQVFPSQAPSTSTLAFSGDSRRLFGFSDGLCVWDVASGRIESRLIDGPVEIGLVAVSGDDSCLAAAVATQELVQPKILRWSLPDLEPLEPLQLRDLHPDPLAEAMGILAMAASPTGDQLAVSCGDSRIRIWEMRSGRATGVLTGHRAPAMSLAFVGDGRWLLSSDGSEIRLWDSRELRETAILVRAPTAEFGPLPGLATGRHGFLATTGDACRIWELAIPSFHDVVWNGSVNIRAMAWSSDRKFSAWLAGDRIIVWDWVGNRLRAQFPVELRGEAEFAFVGESDRLAIVGTALNAIRIADAADGKIVAEWPAEAANVVAARDEREIAVAHSDGVIRRWNSTTGKTIHSLVGPTGPVRSLAYSPDGRFLAAGGEDRSGAGHCSIFIWDVYSGQLVHTIAAHRTIVSALAFSPDAARLAAAGDRSVKYWDVATATLLHDWTVNTGAARGVAIACHGEFVAACTQDGRVLVWETVGGSLMAELSSRVCGSLNGLSFAGDGRLLVAFGGPYRITHTGPGAVEAWDLHEIDKALNRLNLPTTTANLFVPAVPIGE